MPSGLQLQLGCSLLSSHLDPYSSLQFSLQLGRCDSRVQLLDNRGYLVHSRNLLMDSQGDIVIPRLGEGRVGLIWVTISLQRHAIGLETSVHTVKVDLVDDRARSYLPPILERAR